MEIRISFFFVFRLRNLTSNINEGLLISIKWRSDCLLLGVGDGPVWNNTHVSH